MEKNSNPKPEELKYRVTNISLYFGKDPKPINLPMNYWIKDLEKHRAQVIKENNCRYAYFTIVENPPKNNKQ